MKILLYDIETTPILGYTWSAYDTEILEVVEHPYILCFGYKWLGERGTKIVSLPDFKLYKKEPRNDYELARVLRDLIDESDIIVGHNSERFDNKWVNKRIVYHGLPPASPYRSIDTLQIAKRYFRFDRNRLDALGQYLGVGRKESHHGFKTWLDCMNGDEKAWREMTRYNKKDVELLERVYLKLRPYYLTHPNINVLDENINACPKCGSMDIVKRGFAFTSVSKKQRYRCKNCGGWSTGGLQKVEGMTIR